MVQMGTHKSFVLNVPTVELGDTILEGTRSALQVLHKLRCFRSDLYGTYLLGTYAFSFRVRFLRTGVQLRSKQDQVDHAVPRGRLLILLRL